MPALPSWSESDRLAALESYAILDTPTEADFDDIVRLASETFGAPISVVNLIAGNRQWFKAEVGIGARELPIDVSICAHAILQDELMVVPDTRDDPRFACNPLVTPDNGLRFYAGALLRSPQGLPIGTVCVLDRAPRPDGITDHQRLVLEVLARQVMTLLELRKTIRQSEAQARALRGIEERYLLVGRATNDAIWDWDFATDAVQWNAAIHSAYGHELANVGRDGAWWIGQIHPDDRDRIDRSIHAAIDGDGVKWTDEYRFRCADGRYAPVLDRGFIIRDSKGRASRMIGAMLDLTERHQRERALSVSNDRFRAAVAAIDGHVWTNSADGHMHGAQPGWAALTGQSEADYQGYGWANAVHPDDAQATIDAWQRAVEQRQMFMFEHRVRCADGQWRRYSIRAVPMMDLSGGISEWVGIHTDVTERRQQEETIHANEIRLLFLDELTRRISLATSSDDIMAITTRMVATHLNISNCAYADMDSDADGFTIRGDWAAPGSPSIVGRYRLTDFGVKALERLHAGQPLILNDNVREIAPHEAATFQAMGIAATICIPLVKAGRLTALMAIHHRDPHNWSEAELRLINAVAERSWAHVERVRAVQALADLNASLEQRVEERTRQLLEAEEALRQSQKMEAVGQLTGGIAHDFNNLLTIVMGSTDIARRALEAGETSRIARSLDNAQKGAERAAALTQRLLAFSRRQPLAPKAIDAGLLVAGMSDLISRSLGETIALDVVAAPYLWRAEADPNQLENTILNLAVNARDAMPGGGRLTVQTANATIDTQEAAAQFELTPGDYVVITVSDTGEGMSRETLARVFEPFFTTKEVGKGTGLGLSQVYGFVKQSGGHVIIHSELGAGTHVRLYLPRVAAQDEQDVDAATIATTDFLPRAETILVVEDDDDVRAYTVETLREIGYRVLEAHDGMSALRLLERQDVPIDLLFTDVVMPGMSGGELVERARMAQPALRVLYTSGYTRNAIDQDGRLERGVELISKPFTYAGLARKIREVLESGSS